MLFALRSFLFVTVVCALCSLPPALSASTKGLMGLLEHRGHVHCSVLSLRPLPSAPCSNPPNPLWHSSIAMIKNIGQRGTCPIWHSCYKHVNPSGSGMVHAGPNITVLCTCR